MKFTQKALLFASLATPCLADKDESLALRLRRKLRVEAKNFGREHSGNLGLCEGDCNKNEDCRGDLVCFQRDAGDGAPGCSLTSTQRNSRVDFCVAGPEGEAPSPPPPVPSDEPTALTGGTAAPDVGDNNEDSGFIGDTFALKLYWEPGYDWQNEPFERKWCMSTVCRRSCRRGGEIAIFDCDDSRTPQWEFVSHGPNEVQIKVANRKLCIQENPGNDLVLARCDSSNQKQRFVAYGGSFNDRRFEVSPKHRQGWCMTQRHHPKSGEYVNLEPCVSARRQGSNTSYWNKY